ncbi:MAG: hypothetical protein JWP32_296 [Schumannella sp.]|nr:hypothetical protein [Schumannella sp.]
MANSIQTIQTNVTKDDEPATRARQLSYRQEDLTGHARIGYVLVSTITIDSPDVVTIVDTLQRIDAD